MFGTCGHIGQSLLMATAAGPSQARSTRNDLTPTAHGSLLDADHIFLSIHMILSIYLFHVHVSINL